MMNPVAIEHMRITAGVVEQEDRKQATRALLANHPVLLASFNDLLAVLVQTAGIQDLLDRCRVDLEEARVTGRHTKTELAKVERLAAERGPLIEELRTMRAEHDPTRLANLLHAARDEATLAASVVIKNLTSEVVDLRRERDELAASKRKLREALDRAKEKR